MQGFTTAYSGRKICHRCGKRGRRRARCRECELIVCEDCAVGDHLCRTCFEADR